MEAESDIFQNSMEEALSGSKVGAMIIKAGALFSYYRVEHDGKYFFFKTFTEDTPFIRRLLRREFELSSRCDNPHIVYTSLFGEFVHGKEGILMEYVEGQTLTEFLTTKPSLETRRKIFSQLLDAVAYLHKKGIIHNDLKPDNILIASEGERLKLIDFGLSDDDAHYILKTPGCSGSYAAPELKEGRQSDIRSDVYSVGKIMDTLFGNRYRRIANKAKREIPEERFKSIGSMQLAWRRRNRRIKFFAAIVGFLCLALLITGMIISWRSSQFDTSRLQTVVDRQAREIKKQQEEYSTLKNSYNGLYDSLALAKRNSEIHELNKQQRIADFKKGINALISKTEISLRKAKDFGAFAKIRQGYIVEVQKYYKNFDKQLDNEDLSAVLNSLMYESFTESDRRFDEVQKQLFSLYQE